MDISNGYKYLIATPIPNIEYEMIKFGRVVKEEMPVKEEKPFLDITDVRQIGPSSILVKWTVTPGISIDGFEVYVDGQLKSRVFNAKRNTCVLDSIINNNPFIAVFAKRDTQRYLPPATTTFTIQRNV